MRSLPVLIAFLGLVSVSASAAQDPEWFVRKDTKIETYIASVNKIIELDKKAGITIPAYRNETTLPVPRHYHPRVPRPQNLPWSSALR